MSKDILFFTIPLEMDVEKLRAGLQDVEELNKAILEYSDKLAEDDIETWVVEKNLIVTEDGYKVAMYSEEVAEIPYEEKCEVIIKHLITLITKNDLQRFFSGEVLNDALHVKNIYNARQGDSRE